jgi:hypothetical protein
MSDRARRRAAKAQAAVTEIVESANVAPLETVVLTEAGARPKSIRQLVMGMILAGKPTKEIAAEIAVHFPGTAADRKSAKHIAWYRSRMKKDGQLSPKVEATVVPVVDAATAS